MAGPGPEISAAMDALQKSQTALLGDIKNRQGGSVAKAAIDTLSSHDSEIAAVDEREAALLNRVWPRVPTPSPLLLSDFRNRVFMKGIRQLEHGAGIHDVWSVSRSSVRWVWGANGKLIEVESDQPAYAYDPETGESLGIALDPKRTNDIADSNGMSGFSEQRHTRKLASNIKSPTGSNVYAVQRLNESGSLYGFFSGVSYPAGKELSFSFYINPNGHNLGNVIRWWHGSDRIMDRSSYARLSDSGVYVGDGWYRVSLTCVADKKGDVGVSYNISGIETPGDTVYITSPQLEEGKPSTYIPTKGSPATRETDSIYKTLGDEYNPNGFSVYVEAQQNSNIGAVLFLHKGGLTNSIRVGLPTNLDRALYLTVEGNVRTFFNLNEFPGYTAGSPARIVLVLDPQNNRIRLTINGETVERIVDQFPLLEEVRLGNVSANNNRMNGTIQDYRMFPFVLTKEEAEEMAP